MFNIKWDIKNNGIILSNDISNDKSIVPPRPVFYEELYLLGFDKYWKYPKSKAPLLWAIGRRYYYNGKVVAEVKGGNMYDKPQINITSDGEGLVLKAINLKKLFEINKKALFALEHEAIDFIEFTYKNYSKNVDIFAVAFSGGKDSQAILDLVSRVLPPDEYIVSFTDTDMEIPFTYETVRDAEDRYTKLYPELQFYKPSAHEKSVIMWDKFGPPSRIVRWCCSVYKTSPFGRLVKESVKDKDQPRILVFEGTRADESPKRSRYERDASKVKHINITNSRVIFYWNMSEVFLYLMSRNIPLNKGYRYGLTRVGCSVCPFASDWSEYIIHKLFPDLAEGYLKILEKYAKEMGLSKKKEIKNYIKEGHWKKRSGGKGIDTGKSRIDIIEDNQRLKAIMKHPKASIYEWIKVLGNVNLSKGKKHTVGEVKIDGEIIPFTIEEKKDSLVIIVEDILDKPFIKKKFKNVLYKTTYCIQCATCEIECPTGAIEIIPDIKIDTSKCINCHNCITFTRRGCLMAKSAVEGGDLKTGKGSGVARYRTFGLREHWLESYFTLIEKWWESDECTLGEKQIPAFQHWLEDSELIGKNRKETEVSKHLIEIYNENRILFWELMWINLSYNSEVVKWYSNRVKWNMKFTKKELNELMLDDYHSLGSGTVKNVIEALVNTFNSTPIGDEMKLITLEKKGKSVLSITKNKLADKVHPLSVLYSIYKYANENNVWSLTVSDFYEKDCEGGPFKQFGISRESFENILRWLQENKKEIVKVEIKADLDNIYLIQDLTPVQVIEKYRG